MQDFVKEKEKDSINVPVAPPSIKEEIKEVTNDLKDGRVDNMCPFPYKDGVTYHVVPDDDKYTGFGHLWKSFSHGQQEAIRQIATEAGFIVLNIVGFWMVRKYVVGAVLGMGSSVHSSDLVEKTKGHSKVTVNINTDPISSIEIEENDGEEEKGNPQ